MDLKRTQNWKCAVFVSHHTRSKTTERPPLGETRRRTHFQSHTSKQSEQQSPAWTWNCLHTSKLCRQHGSREHGKRYLVVQEPTWHSRYSHYIWVYIQVINYRRTWSYSRYNHVLLTFTHTHTHTHSHWILQNPEDIISQIGITLQEIITKSRKYYQISALLTQLVTLLLQTMGLEHLTERVRLYTFQHTRSNTAEGALINLRKHLQPTQSSIYDQNALRCNR